MRKYSNLAVPSRSLLFVAIFIMISMILAHGSANASSSGGLIDFETPLLGSSARQVIDP